MAISKHLQQKLQLLILLTMPKTLEQVTGKEYNAINQVVYFDININRYKQQRVCVAGPARK